MNSNREKQMSNLIVVGFKDEFTADKILRELQDLQNEYVVDVEDAAIVIWDSEGKDMIALSELCPEPSHLAYLLSLY